MAGEELELLLQRIDTAIERLEWSEVVDLAEQALALEPENPDAQGALLLAKRQLVRTKDVVSGGPGSDIPSSSSFIGRHEELSTLRRALEQAVDGNGSIAMITGEPGIGKTRTAQELISWAESRGVLVLTGRNSEDTGAPPYWPWTLAFRRQTPQTSYPLMG